MLLKPRMMALTFRLILATTYLAMLMGKFFWSAFSNDDMLAVFVVFLVAGLAVDWWARKTDRENH